MIKYKVFSELTLKILRRDSMALCVFSCAISILYLTGPLYMMQVYGHVLNSQSIPTLLGLTLLIVVMYSAMGILEWVRSSLLSLVSSKIEADICDSTLDAALDLRISSASANTSAPILDLQTVRRFVSSPVVSAVFDAPWSIIFLLVLFALHPAYGLLATFGGLVLFIIALCNQITTSKVLKNG